MNTFTEAEAGEKWCPEARVARYEGTTPGPSPFQHNIGVPVVQSVMTASVVGGCNRDALGKSVDPIGSCRCIASRCMMWRWADAEFEHWTFTVDAKQGHPGNLEWMPKTAADFGIDKEWIPLKDLAERGGPPIDQFWRMIFKRPWPNRTGFCGKAGHPDPNAIGQTVEYAIHAIAAALRESR